jgi:hypothetical protein
VTLPVESSEVLRGRLRQSSGMSKSGSSLLSCVDTHVAVRQLPEPVTRCDRNEENWVHPNKKRPLPGSVGREARGTSKSGSSETTAVPCVSNLTSACHVEQGMSKSGSSRKNRRDSSV